jgi:hypothetical protein
MMWPLDEFAGTLVDSHEAVPSMRREFLLHAYEAMTFEGAVPLDTAPQTHTA